MNAYLVMIEHRYFGQSLPFGNNSFSNENLRFCTTEQALGDYIVFLKSLKKDIVQCEDCPLIVFGGSYGGMLASWIRMKFPNVVDGALAASAPILFFGQVVPPEAYWRIVTYDFGNATTVEGCDKKIKQGFNRMDKYINNTAINEYEVINRVFNTCTPLTSNQNLTNAENWLINAYNYMAMVNYPYPTSFLTPLPGNPVDVACQAFADVNSDDEDETFFEALFNSAKVFYNY